MNNNNHGGKRKNAGRKFECERVRLSTCVSPGTHKRLKALAMSQGLTMSKVIPIILEASELKWLKTDGFMSVLMFGSVRFCCGW